MDRIQEKYFDRIIEAYQKENLQADNRFDLFAALNEASNEEAFIYRGGYYIVNKYCNRNLDLKVTDTFYSIYLNALLKFDVMKLGGIEFFEVYKLRDLTGEQIRDIERRINNVEDIGKGQAERILRDLSV
ncbi:MAG: hypothetical protein IJ274_08040 [Lachnospiraceae bacterium]|nr:hypothetical protein [Lachnospiraceae bacterium]